MIPGAVSDEIPQGPERAFIASDRRDVPQGVMKANLRKRPEVCRTEFTLQKLARDSPAPASLEIELPVKLVAHRLNPVFFTGGSYDLRFRDWKIYALRPEQLHQLAAGPNLGWNWNMMRFLALIIEENELGNLFDGSRLSVSLPEDIPTGRWIGSVHVQVPAADLLAFSSPAGAPRLLQRRNAALAPHPFVHGA